MNMSLTANETSSSELIKYGDGDPFAAYATAMSSSAIAGKLLKFSKGDYSAGENGEEVAPGTLFVANMDGLLVGWVKWIDGKPAEHVMGRVAEQWVPPRRAELGCTDTSAWEYDKDGKPKDPWQFTNYLLLMGDEGDLYTFTTSSRGGLGALGKLCHEFARQRGAHPDEWPVISADVGHYQHDQYGKIKFPVFRIHGWWPKAQFADAPDDESGPARKKLQLRPSLTDDLSDTIQF